MWTSLLNEWALTKADTGGFEKNSVNRVAVSCGRGSHVGSWINSDIAHRRKLVKGCVSLQRGRREGPITRQRTHSVIPGESKKHEKFGMIRFR